MVPSFLSSAYAAKRMKPEAVAECRRLMEIQSGILMIQPIAECAASLGLIGERDEARRLLQRLERAPASVWIDPPSMGDAYIGVGDVDRAVQWYQRALEERSPNMLYINAHWAVDAIRGDRRMQSIISQMNFPPS